MTGVLFGGWWCDTLTRWFGQRWGRRLPIFIGGLASASLYLLCPLIGTASGVAVACALVAFASDSCGPAIWSLSQDIGHNHVAATMAWSNMWGNLGASAVAKCIPLALLSAHHFADWREVFWMCSGGFFLLAITILFVDGTQHLPDEDRSVPAA
jgi:MFS family permease